MKLFKKRPRVVLDKYLMKQVRHMATRWGCTVEDAMCSILWYGIWKLNGEWKNEIQQRAER